MGHQFLASEEGRAFCSWGRNLQGWAFHTFMFLLEIGVKLQNHRHTETVWKPLMRVTKNKPSKQEGEKLKERRVQVLSSKWEFWAVLLERVGWFWGILYSEISEESRKEIFFSYDMDVIMFDGGKRFLRYFCFPSIHCLLQITLSCPPPFLPVGFFLFLNVKRTQYFFMGAGERWGGTAHSTIVQTDHKPCTWQPLSWRIHSPVAWRAEVPGMCTLVFLEESNAGGKDLLLYSYHKHIVLVASVAKEGA